MAYLLSPRASLILPLLLSLLLLSTTNPSHAARISLFHFPSRLSSSLPSDIPLLGPVIDINSGGPATPPFLSDNPLWIRGETSNFSIPDARIGGAEDKNLPMYPSFRYGIDATPWGYDLPVREPGIYDCTAHFAEIEFASFTPGSRVFDLTIAGGDDVREFPSIDIIGERSEFTVLPKSALSLVVQGVISVRLTPVVGNAPLSGFTCVRTADLPSGIHVDYTATLPPPGSAQNSVNGDDSLTSGLNVNCGGGTVGKFSADEDKWVTSSDTRSYEIPASDNTPITGAESDDILSTLSSHRFAINSLPFTYQIPVKRPGTYNCSFYFAETYSGSFGTGRRVFDLSVMNSAHRIDSIDVFAEVGSFAALKKTIFDIYIDIELTVTLTPRAGDAFISALSCINSEAMATTSPPPSLSDLDDSFATSTPELEPSSSLPTVTVTPKYSPLPSLTAIPSIVPIPKPESSSPILEQSNIPIPSDIPTVEPEESGDENEVAPSETPEMPKESDAPMDMEIASKDSPLAAEEGQNVTSYFLQVTVSRGEIFNNGMKEALKKVASKGSNVKADWAVVELVESFSVRMETETTINDRTAISITSSLRQDDGTSTQSYNVDLQARYSESEVDKGTSSFTNFVDDGKATEAMTKEGYSNVDVSFRDRSSSGVGTAGSSSGSTSAIVLISVFSALAALVAIAVIAFFVSSRFRNRTQNSSGGGRFSSSRNFQGLPPGQMESGSSSIMARSDSAPSLEYLDDDSTYTVATSRGPEYVEQVGYVRDNFGRGTAAVEEDDTVHAVS